MNNDYIIKIIYYLRNVRSKKLFIYLEKYCNGNVLDIGGRDFYKMIQKKNINYDSWTVIEKTRKKPKIKDKRFKYIVGDGCKMNFSDNSFDTVINIQVLEHVLEPLEMISEISRVLKPNSYCVFLIPQTCTLHGAPNNYYNFTRFWIEEAMNENNLKIIELIPLGGIWSSMASHLFYFYLQSVRYSGMSMKECHRNIFFYFLYPIMILYALINIPICLIFSLGDLTEEPNNHLVVARKIKV